MKKVVGIYKITSPFGKVYIGQSRDIEYRFFHYKKNRCKGQRNLHASCVQFGTKSHKFEVLHELPIDVTQEVLNTYEALYIDQYRDCGFELLNIRNGGTNGKHGEETIKKMKGKHGMWMVGKKFSKESTEKRASKNRGQKRTQEQKDNISRACTGLKRPKGQFEAANERNPQWQINRVKAVKEYWAKKRAKSA